MSPTDGAGARTRTCRSSHAVTEGGPDRSPEGVPELHEVDCPPELRERIETLMATLPGPATRLRSPPSGRCSERYGWCTPAGIRQAAAVMRVTPAYLESVASFYDLLHTEPRRRAQDRRLHQHQLLDAGRRSAA